MPTYNDFILWFNKHINKIKKNEPPNWTYIVIAYKKVIREIKNVYDTNVSITKSNIEPLEITNHMKSKLKWFLAHHKQVRLDKTLTNNIQSELMMIKGIGEKKANELIKFGVKQISDLRLVKFNNMLSSQSKIFIKHNPGRISREFIIKLENVLKQSQIGFTIAGSYRREQKDSGDIDILVFDDGKTPDILHKFLDIIKMKNIKIWEYSSGLEKVSTIAKLPGKSRKVKLDLFRVPAGEEPTFLLYATGSGAFNRYMRTKAKNLPCLNKLGKNCKYLLNQHGLFKIDSNKLKERVDVSSEEDIFKEIGMKYVPPNKR